MPGLIESGRLFLALPPLYRLSQGGNTAYARDDAHKDELLAEHFKGKGKIEVSRFKGLGEMMPKQLKETTMSPENRTLLRVTVVEADDPNPKSELKRAADTVDRLMGKKPEKRFAFIQENARFVENIDV